MWAMKDELLGVTKAAKLYGCSRANIYRLIEDGRLVPLMASPLILRSSDVQALSQANRQHRELSCVSPESAKRAAKGRAARKRLKGNSRSASQLRRRARERRERAELEKEVGLL